MPHSTEDISVTDLLDIDNVDSDIMYDLGYFPLGTNDALPLSVNFEERLRYKNADYFESFGLPKPLDSLYDKNFFGRVDRLQNAIVPKRIPGLYKQLGTQNHMAFDFVANAFFKLKRNLKLAGDTGGIERIQTVLFQIEATSGWGDYQLFYDTLFDSLMGTYEGYLLSLDKREFNKIMTFKDYMDGFSSFLSGGHWQWPITLTEYVLSPEASPAMSGITLKIAEDSHAIDLNKFTKYMRDINFSYYVRAARKFGFYVDKNAPWRLFADPLSRPMQDELEEIWAGQPLVGSMYLRPTILDPVAAIAAGYPSVTGAPFGTDAIAAVPSTMAFPSTEQIYFGYYDRTYTLDLYLLKQKFVAAWNNFVVDHPRVIESVPGTVRCPTTYFRVAGLRYTISLTDAQLLGHRYWFNHYIQIREKETNVRYTNRKRVLDRGMEILDVYGYHEALKYLNNLFKPYLYDERFFKNNPLTKKGTPGIVY